MSEESQIHYVKATVTLDGVYCSPKCDHTAENSTHFVSNGFCSLYMEFCPAYVDAGTQRQRRCVSCLSGKTKEDIIKEFQNGKS